MTYGNIIIICGVKILFVCVDIMRHICIYVNVVALFKIIAAVLVWFNYNRNKIYVIMKFNRLQLFVIHCWILFMIR